MSHPERKKPAPPPDAAQDPAVIDLPGRITCSDRGQHTEARITSFADEQEPGGDRKLAFAETPLWDVLAEIGSAKGATYRFRCRRCGRDGQLREQTLFAVIDALRQAGADRERIVIDVSVLSC